MRNTIIVRITEKLSMIEMQENLEISFSLMMVGQSVMMVN